MKMGSWMNLWYYEIGTNDGSYHCDHFTASCWHWWKSRCLNLGSCNHESGMGTWCYVSGVDNKESLDYGIYGGVQGMWPCPPSKSKLLVCAE